MKVVKAVPETENVDDGKRTPPPGRFKTLPKHIPLKDTISTKDPDAPPDPTMGRNPEVDFMLRNAGF
ncbi:MAG: hypothetical protein ABI934_07780 [Actinomycetota bacterium]